MDNRIREPRDAILEIIDGNLACTKLKLNIYPNLGVPTNTKNINGMLS